MLDFHKIMFMRRSFSVSQSRNRTWCRQRLNASPNHPKRVDLEWLMQRREPAPVPKTVQTSLSDGSVFHAFVKRKPLYKYLDPKIHSEAVIQGALPPLVRNNRKDV